MPYLFDDLKVSSFFSGIGAFETALDRLYDGINSESFMNPTSGVDSACGETNRMIVVGNSVPSKHTAGRIFCIDGISPTVMYRNSKVVQIAVVKQNEK